MLRLTLPPADELERQLTEAKLTGFLREQMLVPGRKFRSDFSWREHRLAVEVDGGTFARQGAKRCRLCGQFPLGRHSTGTGRERDCEKLALTVIAGWRVIVVTSMMVRDGRALGYIKAALSS